MIFTKYRIYFEQEFTVEQIVFAIHEHCKRSIAIPRVSDLMAILKPEPPKVTEAQYIEACKWQERNGYPAFSDAKDIKDRYEAQKAEGQEKFDIQCDKVKEIAANTLKRIEHAE